MAGPLVPASLEAITARSLTRADLKRIHRGEFSDALLAELIRQTQALTAPPLPAEGDLARGEVPWVLTAEGAGARLQPRLTKLVPRMMGTLGFGPLWNHLLAVPRRPVWLSFALTLALGAAPLLTVWAMARLRLRRLLRRRWERTPRATSLAALPTGTTVRLAAVIVEQPTLPSLFDGRPAVLSLNRVLWAQELRGFDFFVALASGERVLVHVRDALVTTRAERTRERPACGPVSFDDGTNDRPARLRSEVFRPPSWWRRLSGEHRRYELALGPGDHLELCGVLHREPAPGGEGSPARGTPMRLALRGSVEAPLLIRRLPADPG